MTRWLICLNRRTYREYLRSYICACWFGSHNMRPFECESNHPLRNMLGEDIAAYGLHEKPLPVTWVSKSFVVHIHRTISIMLAEIQYMTRSIIPFLSSPTTNFQSHLLSAHTTFLPPASCPALVNQTRLPQLDWETIRRLQRAAEVGFRSPGADARLVCTICTKHRCYGW